MECDVQGDGPDPQWEGRRTWARAARPKCSPSSGPPRLALYPKAMTETTDTSSGRWSQRLLGSFPRLDREGRLELLERIEAGARGDTDFVVMMALAATLASLGLLEDSTAVVIGAMLVAPLMGPLVAAGLALVQGNARLFRTGVGVTSLGLGLGFAISLVVGVLNPGFEPAMEIEARGAPDVLDLGIALASGMAAAYAMGRPKLAVTLAGVAIAAVLASPAQ